MNAATEVMQHCVKQEKNATLQVRSGNEVVYMLCK